METSRFTPVAEVADLFSVNRATVIKWIHEGRLVAVKIGGHYRVERASIDELIAKSRVIA